MCPSRAVRRGVPSLAALLLLWVSPASAQTPASLERELRVFFDCSDFNCDQDFLTEQVEWVDFVTDRQVADVHVLLTRQSTGAGGIEYTLRFIGRGYFAGRESIMRQTTTPDATADDRRRALARWARIGLAPFAAETPVSTRLSVELAEGEEQQSSAIPADDPWNRWVFRTSLNGWFNGESSYRSLNTFGSISAGRTTAAWKQWISVHGNRSFQAFRVDDTTTVDSRRESYGASTLVVRSISDHWSVGGHSGWSRSTHSNYDASVYGAPAIEYSFFPYAESTSRLLTLLYTFGLRYYDYAERTIYGQLSEPLVQQRLTLAYDVTQPWGSIDASTSASHFVTSLDGESDWPEAQYGLSLGGGAELRVVRGLSLRLNGWTELVRDQIGLPAQGLTPEEILTQQRELATSYRYYGSFGLTYRFGSIFSTVVNPRFDALD